MKDLGKSIEISE